MSLTHVCHWTPARSGWALSAAAASSKAHPGAGEGVPGGEGASGPGRRAKHKPSELFDLSFELEILSHRGLTLVTGPKHMAIKPWYDALLIQGYTQVRAVG
jgi:hypothetical protein